jgi:hypothetical protein
MNEVMAAFTAPTGVPANSSAGRSLPASRWCRAIWQWTLENVYHRDAGKCCNKDFARTVIASDRPTRRHYRTPNSAPNSQACP